MPGPLDGVKVVEFTEIIAGPFAGMLLSDMGADVIKVEPPWGDPWRGTQPISPTESRVFIAYNRGKRSITLDLTTQASAEVLARLIPQMDVAIVNYRPDVAARLGVDYDSLSSINPQLIYCENTAFGRQGPDSWRPGYDMILQAMTGIMAAESKVSNGAPVHVVSSPFVDTSAGICLAWCVCAALFHRERTGKGQKVETTLLGLALAMLGMRFVEIETLDRENNAATLESLTALREAGVPYPELLQVYEADHPVTPGNIYYRSYQTSDGVVSLGCLSDPLRKRLLNVLGLTDIRFDPDYNPRSDAAAAFGQNLMRQAEEIFLQRTAAEWLTLLDESGIPAGPVRFIEEVFDDPQVQANGLVSELEHRDLGPLRMMGPLASFSETPLEPTAPPALGQHTDEVLAELGFGSAEIDRWRHEGTLG